jgi:hypothetical protein
MLCVLLYVVGYRVLPLEVARGMEACARLLSRWQATRPLVICVALGRDHQALLDNVCTLGLTEGQDYYYFV